MKSFHSCRWTGRLPVLLLLALLSIMTAGCSGGSYSLVMGSIGASQSGLHGSYRDFNGHYFKKVNLEEGQRLTLRFSVDTEEGEIKGVIIDPDGNQLLEMKESDERDTSEAEKDQSGKHAAAKGRDGALDDSQVYNLQVPTSGSYYMKVIGQHHKGSFQFEWQKEE
ncbi:hypothetical protein ABEV00_20695 [Paenibacillus thiaminolyticus]|uniref:hypothetical protein n=1 Tax=Paenibacillus thiaminolyticus TaxID=49283 RepID=UPI003D290DF9